MFHAWFYLLSYVLSTLWSTFHMISWTNLLTRATVPVACFLLFLVPESQKMNILGIGRDKSQYAYFSRRLKELEYEMERGHRVATLPLGAGPPWPRQGVVWAPQAPPRSPLSPIRASRCINPKESIRNPRKVPQCRRHQRGDSGDKKSLFWHPAWTRKCPRSHLH